MSEVKMKTWICIARYYSKGKLYEVGERISVPEGTPMSRAWRDPAAGAPENVPQGPETRVPNGPEFDVDAEGKSIPQGPQLGFESKKANPKATPPSPRRVTDKSL